MMDHWLVTPQYFEVAQPGLGAAAPEAARINGPHDIAGRSAADMAQVHLPIADFVSEMLRDGGRPVSLAGDCCAAVPVLAGLQRAGIDPWLVWVDAHGDFNTPETSPSQFLGGMPLAMAVGRGPQWMCKSLGLRPIAEDRVVLVDARDLDPLEAEALAASGVRHVATIEGLGTLTLDGPVLAHVDLDVIDAAEAPSFNYPVPGGPGAAATARALDAFASGNEVIAVSFSGWDADNDTDGRTAAACQQVMAALTQIND